MNEPSSRARCRRPMKAVFRRVAALTALALLAACSHPAPKAATSPPPGAAPAPGSPSPGDPTTSPTDVPIHVQSEGHVSDSQTTVEHGRQRPLYEILALSDVGDRTASGEERVTFDQAHITFHAPDGNRLIADAPRATVEDRTKEVLMSGGVRAQTQDGAILTCRTLRYDGRTERLHGEGDVRLTSAQGFVLTGDRFDGNVRLDQIHMTRGNAR